MENEGCKKCFLIHHKKYLLNYFFKFLFFISELSPWLLEGNLIAKTFTWNKFNKV